jgi:hypothetical protein
MGVYGLPFISDPMSTFSRFAILPLLTLASPVGAQIVFDHTDLAVPGDVVERYRDTLPTYGPGGSGPDQLWDFSMALTHTTVTTTVSTVAATPYSADFTTSNVAMTENGTDFAFFNNTAATSLAMGGAGDPLDLGQTMVAPFSDPLTLHQFPRTFGSGFTDTYGFQVEIDGSAFGVHSVRLRHRGVVSDTTDGHGQLVTPVGTYDALRVRTVDRTTDSVWVRILSFTPWTLFQTLADTSVTYTWLAKEAKLPVAEMTLDSLGAPARFTFSSVAPISTRVAEQASDPAITVFPVPATDGFTLQVAPGADYERAEVHSMDGRCMAVWPLRAGDRHAISTRGWAPGMYAVRAWRRDSAGAEVVRISVE